MSKKYFQPLFLAALGLLVFWIFPCWSYAVKGNDKPTDPSKYEGNLVKAKESAPLPLALQYAVQNGNKILRTFAAAGGFVGHILQTAPRHYSVIYTVPGRNDVLVVGTLLDGNGHNLTEKYLGEYAPKINYDNFSSRIEEAPAIVKGGVGGEKDAYVMFDPNCIFCHLLWKALLPYEDQGLRVHWIPVGFLKKDSFGIAAALLDSSDPLQSLNMMEAGYVEGTESAALEPEAIVPSSTNAALLSNKKLFDEMGFVGTPAIIYKDRGGHWQSMQGMPHLSALPSVLSIPMQPENDPELKRFQ